MMVRGVDPPHADKHHFLNAALEGLDHQGIPRILLHKNRCKNLIVSIKRAGVKEDLKKDKSSEHPKSKTPPEKATHLSDTFDNIYYRKYRRGWRPGR